VDAPGKNENMRRRVERVTAFTSKVATQLMAPAALLAGLGLLLAVGTAAGSGDGSLLAARPASQLVASTAGFLAAWACGVWAFFSFALAFLLRSGLLARST